MKRYVIDIETDGIHATKIHCLSYCDLETKKVGSITNYAEIKHFVLQKDIEIICHNGIRYDKPTLERLLNIKIKARVIDTLPLSWYLETSRKKHGLEEYGEEFGVLKPKVTDWSDQPIEVYTHRCEEDVKINTLLWEKQHRYLRNLYDEDEKGINRLLNYFQFKMECVRDQEELGLRLDVEKCKRMVGILEKERAEKKRELASVMPKVPVYKKKSYSQSVVNKNGELSMKGELFYTPAAAIPQDREIKQIVKYKDPNPNSVPQLKAWLYSLGWVPEHIKHNRDKATGEISEVPQIGSKDGGGEVCDSVKKLYDKEPKLELLNGLSILNHRISIFEGLLKEQVDGRIYPSMAGLTNTMRLQHKVVVNLPGVDRKYGADIRGCFLADEGHVLCGSDLSNIEDRTKRHYIYDYDPAYVEEMNVPGFDAHLDIGMKARMITEKESDFYKVIDKKIANNEDITDEEKKEYKRIKPLRHKGKTVNFSATYKVGWATLSRNSGMPPKEARKLLDIFWERNKAILQVEESLHVKEIGTQKWLLNPVSGYWYSLRAEKDRFSTLNQGTAVYVFDIWITFLRKMGLRIPFQYHDETLFNVLLGKEDEAREIVNKAMDKTNEKLKLNVQAGCSTAWGPNYAECH